MLPSLAYHAGSTSIVPGGKHVRYGMLVREPSITLARAGRAMASPNLYVMAVVLLTLGFYLLYPILLLFIHSFNVASLGFFDTPQWGLDNWRAALQQPGVLASIRNSLMIWGLTIVVSLPAAILISWLLARTRIPFSHGFEFMFWLSYMLPSIGTTIGWITLLDPRIGLFNIALRWLPFVEQGPFNIFSVAGIVWANLMANGISLKIMLLTPAFRNMDAALEEAARVSGASNMLTMLRVTIPLMIAPITLIFALQLLRVFQSFETELLLGTPFDFFVYSTLMYHLVNREPPLYGEATALASLTILIIALIIPLQRWILHRRQYTTISAGFKPGLISLGVWKWPVVLWLWFLVFILTLLPTAALLFGSFMVRAGFFNLNRIFTSEHWVVVLTDNAFLTAVTTTITLGVMAAILSPLLFSLIAYILVRTRWRGRGTLDWVIWGSGAIPGMLSGLGLLVLFLGTPGFSILFGTIWALILVVVISGNTTGTNIMKGTFIQVGQDMEDAARIAGANWITTYVKIWIPLMMRTLMLLAVLNFVNAVGATSSIILLASRETMTLSILALEYRLSGQSQESASIIALVLIFITVVLASIMRSVGLRLGVHHQ